MTRATAAGVVAFVVVVLSVAASTKPWQPRPSPNVTASTNPSPVWVHLVLSQPDPEVLGGFEIWAGAVGQPGLRHISVPFERPVRPASEMTRALPFVSQPRAGRFTYGFFDGTGSELHLVDIASGDDRTIASGTVIYHSADQDASGTVFAILLDTASRTELGIYQISEGADPRQIVAPRELPFAALQGSTLRVAPSGERLMTADCSFSSCTLRVYDTLLGIEIGMLAIGNSTIVGVTEEAIGLAEPCWFQCPRQIVAIKSLTSDQIGLSCGAAVLSILDGRDVIVSGSDGDCSANGDRLIAQWPDRGRREVGSAQAEGLQLVQPSPYDGLELPPGSVVLTEDGTLGVGGPEALLNIGTRQARMISSGP